MLHPKEGKSQGDRCDDHLARSGDAEDHRQKEKKKHFGYYASAFEETMVAYEARTADCCEVGNGCCAPRILEAEPDFATGKFLLETVNVVDRDLEPDREVEHFAEPHTHTVSRPSSSDSPNQHGATNHAKGYHEEQFNVFSRRQSERTYVSMTWY